MSFLEPIRSDIKYGVPIVLIDVSGSTKDIMDPKNDKHFKVKDYEFQLAKEVCEKSCYPIANVVCWSSEARLYKNVDMTSDLKNEYDDSEKYSRGTELKHALVLIEKEELVPKGVPTEIIIVTDGEIFDGAQSIGQLLRKLLEKDVTLRIVAVEPNGNDYLNGNCQVGNKLFKIIQSQKMTRVVTKFSIYNRSRIEFVNLSNPRIPVGYIPFQDSMFKAVDVGKFLVHIDAIIRKKVSEDQNEKGLLKFVHELSLTVFHLTEKENHKNRLGLVDTICEMFKSVPKIYQNVRENLLNELDNHAAGQSQTFTSINKNRKMLIEDSRISMFKDTWKSVAGSTNEGIKFSVFIKSDGICTVLSTYDDELDDYRLCFNSYGKSAIGVDKYRVPLIFEPNSKNGALQWIRTLYGSILNISPENNSIIYMFLIDAFIAMQTDLVELKNLYRKYVDLFLQERDYEKNKTYEQLFSELNPDILNERLLNRGVLHYGRKADPLNLLYEVLTKVVKCKVDDGKLEKFCVDRKMVLDLYEVNSVMVNKSDKITYEPHFVDEGKKVQCFGMSNNVGVCTTCLNPITFTKISKSDMELLNKQLKPILESDRVCWSPEQHCDVGQLDGVAKEMRLVKLDDGGFDKSLKSYSLNNIMIVDPLNTIKMKIVSQKSFNDRVDKLYGFLRDIDMENVALCGGFARSVLLGQRMKDFDFFIHGTKDHFKVMNRLLKDIIMAQKKIDPTLKFVCLYKQQFNVFEIVSFNDPTNHISTYFNLNEFDKFEYDSLRRFNYEDAENTEFKFEDGDKKNIKMKHRFQIIMCSFDSVGDIFKSFDMFPSQVAYDGKLTWFSEKAVTAYRYMVNEINLFGGNDLIKHRISKYFKYGFSIVFPKSKRDFNSENYGTDKRLRAQKESRNENVGPLRFKVKFQRGNILYINHNSNIASKLERSEELEAKMLEKSKLLYVSNLFCSFVSLLRYVCINKIPYSFVETWERILKDDEFNTPEQLVQMKFLDKYDTIYPESEWYEDFVKSLVLEQFA